MNSNQIYHAYTKLATEAAAGIDKAEKVRGPARCGQAAPRKPQARAERGPAAAEEARAASLLCARASGLRAALDPGSAREKGWTACRVRAAGVAGLGGEGKGDGDVPYQGERGRGG